MARKGKGGGEEGEGRVCGLVGQRVTSCNYSNNTSSCFKLVIE